MLMIRNKNEIESFWIKFVKLEMLNICAKYKIGSLTV